MPNQKRDNCGDRKFSPADFLLFSMGFKLEPQMSHLDYAIATQTLQYFSCLLKVSADFRWWSNMFISPQRRELVPLHVLAYLNLCLYSTIQGYYCDTLPIFIFTDIVVLL